MRINFYIFSVISIIIIAFTGCSVANPGKTLDPVAGNPGATPPDAVPVTPVLVSEPMPVVTTPVENSPEATPAPNVEETPEPIAIIEQTPTTPEANIIDVTENVTVSTPVASPEVTAAPLPDSYENSPAPAPIPSPVASSDHDQDAATPAPAPQVSEPIVEAQPIPPAIMEVVEISNPSTDNGDSNPPESAPEVNQPAPISNVNPMPAPIAALPTPEVASPAPTPASAYDEDEGDGNNDNVSDTSGPSNSNGNGDSGNSNNDEDTEFVVNGTCLGKKNAGVVWYDHRKKDKKQNTSVKCKNNKFEIKIKDKKKNLPFLEMQTLFFD